jgi:hypothetical protein
MPKPSDEMFWPLLETAPPIYAIGRPMIMSSSWGAGSATRPEHALLPLKIEPVRQGTARMRLMIARTRRRTGLTRWTK